MVMAGICAGHPRTVEMETGLRDYILLQQHWLMWGPPVHVAVAAYLGIAKGAPDTSEPKNAAQFAHEITGIL